MICCDGDHTHHPHQVRLLHPPNPNPSHAAPITLGTPRIRMLCPTRAGTCVVPNAFTHCYAPSLTPNSYQTNLMVMGPGGYTFVDFTKLGAGLCLACVVTTVALVIVMAPLYADHAGATVDGNAG